MNQQKRNCIYLLLFLCLLTACSISPENQKKRAKIDKYFDLAGLMQQQIHHLSTASPTIHKKAMIDGQEEAIELDSVNWKKELGIFTKADINKPRLLSQYLTSTYTDTGGNRVTQYKNVEEHVSGVIRMKIVEEPTTGKLLSIFIESGEYNTLFTAEVEMQMNFEEKTDTAQLTSYSISGYEKVVLRDTMRYAINVKVG